MKYTHILWDFNGTLINDVAAGIRSVNIMLEKRNMPTVDDMDYYYSVFRFPIKDYYASLGFDYSKEPYEELAVEWVNNYKEVVKTAQLQKGVREALEYFSGLGLKQNVFSMSELNMLCGQLGSLGILDFFDEIWGLDNIHAASKLDLAKSWREAHPDAHPLLIGDTTHDFEASVPLEADCILVAGGHQSEKALRDSGAKVVKSAYELKLIV